MNKFNLPRNIPNKIKRQVRQNSKNGCVICRKGVYQYEHIIPEYKDAKEHNPENICCLCGHCHDKVTRGLLSKETIQKKYAQIKLNDDIKSPWDLFDFDGSDCKLKFGDLIFEISPEILFKVDDNIIFALRQRNGQFQGIDAKFYGEDGNILFEIIDNEWIGPSEKYDIKIEGSKFTIKLPTGQIGLQLTHEAPNIILIERLDMRYKDVHILASSKDLAIGRYNGYAKNVIWIHVKARIDRILNSAVAVNIHKPNPNPRTAMNGISIRKPCLVMNQDGKKEKVLSTNHQLLDHIDTLSCGIYWPEIGIQIAKGCAFAFGCILAGISGIEHARKHFFLPNRMNIRSFYLPAVFNGNNLANELKMADLDGVNFQDYPEPFLVLENKKDLRAWKKRQEKLNVSSLIATPFLDDQPGLYNAIGLIKLVDKYDGPAIQVAIKPN